MPRKLSQMTTQQVKEEMSIAGNPDKLIKMLKDMEAIMHTVDDTNAAELLNLELVMQRLLAEVRWLIRRYYKRTGQKIR